VQPQHLSYLAVTCALCGWAWQQDLGRQYDLWQSMTATLMYSLILEHWNLLAHGLQTAMTVFLTVSATRNISLRHGVDAMA
jgi:hypothetical protein